MDYLIFIIGGVIGFVVSRVFFKQGSNFKAKSVGEMSKIRISATKALTKRTERRKERILEFMKDEEERQERLEVCSVEGKKKGVTDNDIEKLLDVSKGTARKYLKKLKKEGKVEKVNDSEKGVYYILK